MSKCRGCNNPNAVRLHTVYTKDGLFETCDHCGDMRATLDYGEGATFKEPYFDEHLADKKNPHGQWVNSRAHKAAIMREQGIREKSESTIPYIKDPVKRKHYFLDRG